MVPIQETENPVAFEIYLDDGQKNVLQWFPDTNLKEILEKLCFKRETITFETHIPKDMQGNEIKDLDVTLAQLGFKQMTFFAKRSGKPQIFQSHRLLSCRKSIL